MNRFYFGTLFFLVDAYKLKQGGATASLRLPEL